MSRRVYDQDGNPLTIAGQDAGVYIEVALERREQDAKWGEQNHPLTQAVADADWHERMANEYKALNDARAPLGTWDGVLLEEVHEAFAELDPRKARAELVQVAAVAVAAIESIDRAEEWRKRALG